MFFVNLDDKIIETRNRFLNTIFFVRETLHEARFIYTLIFL
jgi:hypothetical protein